MNMFSGISLAGPSQVDRDRERSPPPPCTPVRFPAPITLHTQPWSDQNRPSNLQTVFGRSLASNNISQGLLEATNIRYSGCPITAEEFLPLDQHANSYLPSVGNDQTSKTANGSSSNKDISAGASAGASAGRGLNDTIIPDFEARLTELRVENDAAFRAISRTTPAGAKPPRLAYLRSFWTGLEGMSLYWDTSLDDYHTAPIDSADGRDLKRQRTDAPHPTATVNDISMMPTQATSSAIVAGPGRREIKPAPEIKLVAQTYSMDRDADTPTSEEESKLLPPIETSLANPVTLRYKGRRTGTGREMPDIFRTNTLKGLVEAVVFSFQCRLNTPAQSQLVHLQLKNLRILTRRSAAVYQIHNDGKDRRSVVFRGPVLAVSARNDTSFQSATCEEFDAKSPEFRQSESNPRLDLLREIGSLLLLAQERAREGKTESKPGEGKFWTSTPRWGGGTGGEFGLGGSDPAQIVKETGDASKEKSKASKPIARYEKDWKKLECGSSSWDRGTKYTAVGKAVDAEYDEIFMLSGLNHHVSILKLRVHKAYIDYTLTESWPNPLPLDPDWSRPNLQRTKWFDLFDVDDRIEAFRILWGIMTYLTRDLKTANEDKPSS